MIKGGTGQRSLLFLFLLKKDYRLLTATSFQGESSCKKRGGIAFIYNKKLPSMVALKNRKIYAKLPLLPQINTQCPPILRDTI